MKTVFITIFEGIEAKNILRTDVLPIIIKDKKVKVVLLVKEKNRAELYEKEFGGDRVVCEVVDMPEITGLDKIFSNLKFILLRTESTKLWRRFLYEKRNNYILYRLGDFVNILLALPIFVKIARVLDNALVKNDTYSIVFSKYNPDLVFLANLFDDAEIHVLREAKRRGIKTLALINSWDRTTSRCIIRLLPDKFIVFSELIRKDLVRFHVVRENKIYISGIPNYDFHFRAPFVSREKFYADLGLDLNRRILLYAPFGLAYSNADWEIIKILNNLNKRGRFGPGVSILVRCPPNDEVDVSKFKDLPDVIYEFPGMRFSRKKGTDWDMTEEELKHLSDSLYYMSVMVCYASSISIDAAVFDKPVINVNFDVGDNTPGIPSPRRHYVKRHYAQALKSGGIKLVSGIDELVLWVKEYIDHPRLHHEERRKLVEEQCVFLDGKSAERIGRFILNEI